MINQAQGNLLRAPVEALVNTVNTEGVMGKGIALQFKNAYPEMFKSYSHASKGGEVKLGSMHVWPTNTLSGPKYVINFPTKGHWRAKSRMRDIESGLKDLVRVVRDLGISSIAIPPLGCGNGGLDWREVEPRIRTAFDNLPEVDVLIFAPEGAPAASNMVVNTTKPAISPGRAALVGMVARYTRQALNAPSLIETQKLMYFLQLAGEPLRLNFEANRYGPYADNLRHVLAKVEGHLLTGYGDGSSKVLSAAPLSVVAGAVEDADRVLDKNPETKTRMQCVLDLAAGYESAYGLELLATVHWVVSHNQDELTKDVIAQHVADWSERKAGMFTAAHVDRALSELREHGWVA
ncbi:macro domain-containing protein [uncultured Salinibacterium sp.]|uniref:type II toxin-antitoxin system antitoxin DNA ADP-ribosyl glycohydrolase DarG n=1 Tax=uncultured Salinibacterium sp. TaxID=459274 RepID=UPI0030DA8E37|tara:strand:- start:14371 stop:15417 length:1047 start_codon:yes stop_codon:yes gene_type:complete